MERIQKIIARSGIASRRCAEEMIRNGRVSVNERTVTVPGTKADAVRDRIRVDGKLISTEGSPVYIVLHKPRGYISSLRDPQGRPVVTDLLGEVRERVFPVGRLDYDSEGLLLLTSDGDFSYRIQHPKFEIAKIYRVKIKGGVTGEELARMRRGCSLSDGWFKPQHIALEKSNRKSCWMRMTIVEGKNRIIRRFFDALGRPVVRLIRVSVGEIEIGTLREGEYRYMNEKEVTKVLGGARQPSGKKKS